MRPFPARRPALHAAEPGKPTISRRARRQREKIELAKRAKLADLELQRKGLEVTRELDGYHEEKAARVEDRKATATRQTRAEIARRLRAFRTRLDNDRPLLAALVVSGLCVLTTIGGQVMVYSGLNWHGWAWIGLVLPLIVEGGTWANAIYAQWLATRPQPLPYGRYLRWMWFFASYAAGSNTWHFARDLHDPITGALLGGASIVGPFIWHSYVGLTKLARSGRSAAQIRAALLQRIYHPLLSARTTSLWSAANATMTRDMAWRLTWEAAKGCAPGLRPAGRVQPTRNQWLFRLIFGRVAATPTATLGAPPATATPAAAGQVAQPAPDATPDTSATPLADEVAHFLQRWAATPEATMGDGAVATLEPPAPRRSGRVAQPDTTAAATPREVTATPAPQVARNPPQPPATAHAATAADVVARYYRNQVADGATVSATDAANAAREAGLRCSRQNAAKIINKLRDRSNGGAQ